MSFFDILAITLPVFLMVAVGAAIRVLGVIDDQSEKSIMRLIVNLLYPCFILSKVPGSQSLQNGAVVVGALGIGFLMTGLGFAIAYGAGRVARISGAQGRSTFSLAAGLQNYGFIPIPLIIELFPDSSSEMLSVLFVHNLGLELCLWTIGIMMLSGSLHGSMKRLLNGPTIAILIGLTLNFSGLYVWIPGVVAKGMSELGNCSIPMSLVLVGATLAAVVQQDKWHPDWQVVIGSILVRYGVMPIVFFGVASQISFSPELKQILIIQAAMPSAIFPIVLAKHYGGTPKVAVQVFIATSIVSLVMTPVVLAWGLSLFGILDR